MREYELAVIYDLELAEAEGPEASVDRVKHAVEAAGGVVKEVDHWGRRRMAYPINKVIDGDFIISRIEVDPASVAMIEGALRIDERAFRTLVVRADELFEITPMQDRREQRPYGQRPPEGGAPAPTADGAAPAPAADGAMPEVPSAEAAPEADAPAAEAAPTTEAPTAEVAPTTEAPATEAAPEAEAPPAAAGPVAEEAPVVAEAPAEAAPEAAEPSAADPDPDPGAAGAPETEGEEKTEE
jgi:small subunit ribosomal protein S6